MSNKSCISIFCFHDVNDKPSQFCKDFNLNVSPKLFINQIEWIRNEFSIISPVELLNNNKLPHNPALITFDDAFLNAFKNGIDYLVSNHIPSIMFINMSHIINNSPLISSRAVFYEKFVRQKNSIISNQFHLKLNPTLYKEILNNSNKDYEYEIKKYQGSLATYDILKKYSNNKFVFFGNHLFSHWNSIALNNEEFKLNIKLNNLELNKFSNFINIFAFPNGQPGSCFNLQNIQILKQMGVLKAFYSSGNLNINSNNYLLDRMDLTNHEYGYNKFYLRIFISKFRNKFLKKLFGLIRKI
jgi:peptidoglycan/xylan/chitin deacetylase (PgdA/CDA1 family)